MNVPGAETSRGIPAASRPGSGHLGEGLVAFIVCAAMATLVTWPLLPQISQAILGHERCTNLMHVWTYWAVSRALHDGDLPILFDYIFYPSGGNLIRLYGSDLLYPPLFAALQPAFDPGTLFNVKMLFSMTVAPFGMFILLRHLGLGFTTSLLGGAFFSVTPYFMLESLNGVAELVSVEWLPFAVFSLLRTFDQARVRDAALCALFSVMAIYASAYNAFFLILFGGVALVHQLSMGPRLQARHLKAGLALAALGVVGMLPFVALHSSGETASSLKAKQSTFKDQTSAPTADASADLVRFFRPGRNTIPEVFERGDGGRDEVYTTYTTYLGYVVLAFALLAVSRRRPRLRLWTWSAGFFMLVALGPYLRVLGAPVTLGESGVPLPSLALYHALPGFSVTARHTYRYVTMVHLSLAVLAAFGVQLLANQMRHKALRAALPVGVGVLLFTEVLLVGPAPWPIPQTRVEVPEYYHTLAQEPGRAAIIELPFTRNHLRDLQRYLYFQTVHEKPWIDGGMHFRVRQEALDYVKSVPLAQNFLAEHTIDRPMNEGLQLLSTRLLQKRGYRYILVHDAYFEDAPDALRTRAYLEALYGPPLEPERGLAVFHIALPEEIAGK